MINEGYTCNGGQWTSPYSGQTTSFQPAREEFMIVRNLGIAYKTPMDWMREVRRLKSQNKALLERVRQLEGRSVEPTPSVEASDDPRLWWNLEPFPEELLP